LFFPLVSFYQYNFANVGDDGTKAKITVSAQVEEELMGVTSS